MLLPLVLGRAPLAEAQLARVCCPQQLVDRLLRPYVLPRHVFLIEEIRLPAQVFVVTLRRGTSVRWPVERVPAPPLLDKVVRFAAGRVAWPALPPPEKVRHGFQETHTMVSPVSVPVAAMAL